jgi:hypothetical protein
MLNTKNILILLVIAVIVYLLFFRKTSNYYMIGQKECCPLGEKKLADGKCSGGGYPSPKYCGSGSAE